MSNKRFDDVWGRSAWCSCWPGFRDLVSSELETGPDKCGHEPSRNACQLLSSDVASQCRDDAVGAGVADLDWRGWPSSMRVVQMGHAFCTLWKQATGANFSFSGRGHDVA
jgi:hypothetical protein